MIIKRLLNAPLLACLCYGMSLHAHALYKCEAQGKVSYADTPCAGGKPLNLDEQPAASADAAEAAQRHARNKSELKRLEDTRRKRDAQDEKEQLRLARANRAKTKKCATLAQRQKWAQEDAAQASGKSAGKATVKARRAAETFELECGK